MDCKYRDYKTHNMGIMDIFLPRAKGLGIYVIHFPFAAIKAVLRKNCFISTNQGAILLIHLKTFDL
jgi:hypothetical protein